MLLCTYTVRLFKYLWCVLDAQKLDNMQTKRL